MNYKTERRRAERFKVNLEAHWEGVLERQSGTVEDISSGGCFILTAHRVQTGELIRISIGDLLIWGEVIYEVKEMGFALRFTAGVGDGETQLDQVIAAAKAAGTNAKEQDGQPK